MMLGVKQLRKQLAQKIEAALQLGLGEFKAACSDWLANLDNGKGTRERADR
jgi:pyruvate-ferredoxin/flavodoxin oxidoreductase